MLQKIRSNDNTAELVENLASPYIPNPRGDKRSDEAIAVLSSFSARLLAVVPTVVGIPAPGIRSSGRSSSLCQFFAGHTLSPGISLSGKSV